jgi:DNA-3-methyladenine glycosylase II
MTRITHIATESDLDAALIALTAADPRFHAVIAKGGRPPLRRRADGYAGLAATVVSQQLSTASAAAIWARIVAAFDPLTPEAIVKARPQKLARLGLSRPKIKALKEIARAVIRGEPDLTTLCDLAAEDAHAALTAVHGIGPWTADIYLLACLGHADAWPAGDLALQEAARLAFGLAKRPSTKEMSPLAEAWRPHRAVAARVLWTYYRAVKGREGAPTLPKVQISAPKTASTKRSGPSKTKAAKTKVAKTKPATTKLTKKPARQHREKKHARSTRRPAA